MNTACIARLNKEIRQLELEPPPGVSAWPKDNKINNLEAIVQGPVGTPYEGGTFKLEILVPDRYPFEPPKIRFLTPIYHPNIDNGGRICLDTLNMPPKGQWKPAVNLSTLLATIQQLLGDPNPDDGLVPEITREYKHDRLKFEAEARARTLRDAVDNSNRTLQKSERQEQNEDVSSHDAQRKQETSFAAAESDAEDSEDEDEEDEELDALWGKSSSQNSHRGGNVSAARDGAEARSGAIGRRDDVAAQQDSSNQHQAEQDKNKEVEVVEDSEEEGSGDDIFTQSFLGGKPSSANKRPFSGAGADGFQKSRQRQKI